MRPSEPTWVKLDQRLTSAPRTVGAQTVQLVVRQSGWRLTRGAGSGGFSGALVRLQPITLLVRRGAEESSIPIADPMRFTQNTLLKIAVAISVICGVIMFVVRRMSRNRPIIPSQKNMAGG